MLLDKWHWVYQCLVYPYPFHTFSQCGKNSARGMPMCTVATGTLYWGRCWFLYTGCTVCIAVCDLAQDYTGSLWYTKNHLTVVDVMSDVGVADFNHVSTFFSWASCRHFLTNSWSSKVWRWQYWTLHLSLLLFQNWQCLARYQIWPTSSSGTHLPDTDVLKFTDVAMIDILQNEVEMRLLGYALTYFFLATHSVS